MSHQMLLNRQSVMATGGILVRELEQCYAKIFTVRISIKQVFFFFFYILLVFKFLNNIFKD